MFLNNCHLYTVILSRLTIITCFLSKFLQTDFSQENLISKSSIPNDLFSHINHVYSGFFSRSTMIETGAEMFNSGSFQVRFGQNSTQSCRFFDSCPRFANSHGNLANALTKHSVKFEEFYQHLKLDQSLKINKIHKLSIGGP